MGSHVTTESQQNRVDSPESDSHPVWSPDGKFQILVYLGGQDGVRSVLPGYARSRVIPDTWIPGYCRLLLNKSRDLFVLPSA